MLAKCKDRQAAIFELSMFGGKIIGNAWEKGPNGNIGNIGKGASRSVRGMAVLDGLHVNLEFLVIGPAPGAIKPVFNHVFTRQARVKFHDHILRIGQFFVKT